jgi:hypothetical protein
MLEKPVSGNPSGAVSRELMTGNGVVETVPWTK